MFRKTILIFLSLFSFSYAVDEIDIEKRRQEQQDFDNLIKSQNFSAPKSSEDNEQKNLILNVNSIVLEGNTIFEDFQIDALLRKYIGKDRDIYALINELENKYYVVVNKNKATMEFFSEKEFKGKLGNIDDKKFMYVYPFLKKRGTKIGWYR